MYKTLELQTFNQLAQALMEHQKVAVKVYSSSPGWGATIARRLQSIFIEEAKRTGGSPMSASYDEFEKLENEEGMNLFKFSLSDIKNKALIHHAKLTRFKEEEL
jgi:hypothetical protein